MDFDFFNEIVCVMVVLGKGIFVVDEFIGMIGKCFVFIGLDNILDNCCDWCEMFFCIEEVMSECIFGVILYDEIICQKVVDGMLLVKMIQDVGFILGIKVDIGVKGFVGVEGEMIIEGFDGLCDCLVDYFELGVCFVKWCVVINIGQGGDDVVLSQYCININMYVFVCYVVLCQEVFIVLIVELEVIMDGDYFSECCYEVIEFVFKMFYCELFDQGVVLEGMIFKLNMVIFGIIGLDCVGIEEVVDMIVQCLVNCVLVVVLGIVFLFGGQMDEEVIVYFSVMNVFYELFWLLIFFYGCVLQVVLLKVWGGKFENIVVGQVVFNYCVKMNGFVVLGEWEVDMEKELV